MQTKLTIDRLMSAYRSYMARIRGAWYRHKFHRVGTGLEVKGKLEMRGPGKVIAGKDLHLSKNVTLNTLTAQSKILIGNEVDIGDSSYIGAHGQIIIGDNTAIAGGVTILSTDFHGIDGEPTKERPILIGRHVWIGLKAIILEGVTIGDNAIVGAGSVVTKSVAPNSIVAGNPARFIRETKRGMTS